MRRSCFITGGASQVASWLVPRLIDKGCGPLVIARGQQQPDYGPGAQWHFVDLTNLSHELPTARADTLFHTAQIGLLPAWIERFHIRGVTRIIAFGTTSIFTKVNSGSASERKDMEVFRRAERQIADKCLQLGIKYTIFRPTLIYGGRFGDRNVSDIARIISRFGFFPLCGHGDGLRQPVHAADLADACLLACDSPATFNRSYDLAGGERLPYRMMVDRIFARMDCKPRFVRVPGWLFSLAIGAVRMHPRYRHLTADMAGRMHQHMVFDISEAENDFGYSPRTFTPVIFS
jgi:nucleoside-diphosphate-sugar epimerase